MTYRKYERGILVKGGKVAYQKRLYDEAIAAFVDAVLLKRQIMLYVSMADNKKATKARYHMYHLNVLDSSFVTIARWKSVPLDRYPASNSRDWRRAVTPDEGRELLEKVKDKMRGRL